MNTTRLEANIQHLKPDTQYEVRVVAFNRAGPSSEHAEFVVTTEKEGELSSSVCVGEKNVTGPAFG